MARRKLERGLSITFSMRRYLLLSFLLLAVVTAGAQSRQSLRDSLAKASDALAYHPDSVDLRLKKASWNLKLEQWEYALNEYTRILDRHPDNLAALFSGLM